MFNLQEYRSRARSFADLLNYGHIVDNGVIMNKDGSFTSAAEFWGPDLDTASNSVLEALNTQVNNAFLKLDTGWTIQVDAIRRPCSDYPDSQMPDLATAAIEAERKERYQSFGSQFQTAYVMTLTYSPSFDTKEFQFSKNVSGDAASFLDEELATFNRTVEDVIRIIGGGGIMEVARLSTVELVRYVHLCITGENSPLQVAPNLYLDTILGSRDFVGGVAPRLGSKHIRVVSISGFPSASYMGILDALSQCPLTYRWNTRFIAMSAKEGVEQVKKYRKTWFGKRTSLKDQARSASGSSEPSFQDGDAIMMAADADEAAVNATSGALRFGYYTSCVVIMDDDEKRVAYWAREIQKTIEGVIGFATTVEEVNAVEAYLGSLPSNRIANVRKPLMHSRNLADLLPLTNVFPGEEKHPCPFYPGGSPALIYAVTNGSTPFRLNLHVGDLGHTLILGPTGSGKSTLLGLITAQHFRYPNAQVFVFDKGYSAYALNQAAGGQHYDVMGEGSELTFYPLAHIDNPNELAWAADWVETLLVLQGLPITVQTRNLIYETLTLMSSQEDRTMQALHSKLPTQALRDALEPYVQGGQMGKLLDAEVDGLDKGKFQVFELEHLMALGGDRADKWVVPVLLYLFNQIEKRLDGSPTLIVLDEAWLLLDHPLFQAKIREWLKVLRKANAAVVFATQSISDVLNSKIRDVILESCPTKILLPNREARSEMASRLYEQLGLSEREIEILASATPKQDYFYSSSLGKRLISLGLGPVTLSFIGASDKKSLKRIKELQAKTSDTSWVWEWLQERGQHRFVETYQNALPAPVAQDKR